VFERRFESAPHGVGLGLRGGAVEPIHRTGAQGGMADLTSRIERRRISVERREIALEGCEKLLRLSSDDVEWRRRVSVDR
jgi:hypothetical protein